jgi:hypothetical protein
MCMYIILMILDICVSFYMYIILMILDICVSFYMCIILMILDICVSFYMWNETHMSNIMSMMHM